MFRGNSNNGRETHVEGRRTQNGNRETSPQRSSPNSAGGCQKRIGSGGTSRSKPTLRLGSWISWCARRSKRKPRGRSRTSETSHNGSVLGLLCEPPRTCPESSPTQLRPPERKPAHPSLHFKKVGKLWPVRAGPHHRALAVEDRADFVWVWVGPHDEYERRIKRLG